MQLAKPIVPERSADDVRLEKEFADKLNAHEETLKAQVASLRRDRDDTALERAATEIANKLAVPGTVELLLPHIRERLTASDAGGHFEITAKDAASLEHLAEQFRTDPKFARVIVGAAPLDAARHQQRVNETLGVVPLPASVTRQAFEQMTPAKRAAYARTGGRIADA
jgi:hypothetical protein